MLCALCFDSALAEPEPENPSGLRRQLETAERQLTELRASLVRTERDLERLQARYAELYLESRKQADEMEYMRLRIAALLTGKAEDGGPAAAMVEYLSQVLNSHRELYAAVRRFGDYLETVLDALQPSAGMRREISGRYADLVQAVDRLERMPSIVAGRGGEANRTRRECRILAVNDELQVIVLDAGADDGVRPGGTWRAVDDQGMVGMLRVIEVRPRISAAMPVDRAAKVFAPGMKVLAEYAVSDGQ